MRQPYGYRLIGAIERWLPFKAPSPRLSDDRMPSRDRYTRWVVLLVAFLPLTNLLRRRHLVDVLAPRDALLLRQVALVAAACVVVAALGFGIKAWRDARVAG